ncbi:14648_t:CDS:2, partial [Racocetra persica]
IVDPVEIYEIAQNNREFCQNASNIETTMSSLNKLQRDGEEGFQNKEYYKSFRKFIQASNKIKSFVNMDFDSCMTNLHLAVTIEALKDNSSIKKLILKTYKIDQYY